MIRVLVADDHAVVREGIKRIIQETGDLTVAGEAASGPELLSKITADTWDVVLLDLAMPGPSALDVLEEIHRLRPKLPVLVLSMYPEEQYAIRTLVAGAMGYLNKESPPDELVRALRTVTSGRKYISGRVAESLVTHVGQGRAAPPHEKLSNREYQVLCLIAAGKSVSEIAEELLLSVKTISTFRTRILDKLELRSNADIIRYALKHGIVE